ncbi:hypothetical protein DFP72DRAFT_1169882 [Ephemerocybe angulata]|uniref:F-box domain-containing protein n=1 Tax=Ephemerocybe angulata TaxID=980116 RepID=A0A8H6M434_9AGAR|nr:hypothetical protein DFP72DRAFT_1169882 [Tulosesus angulatus]
MAISSLRYSHLLNSNDQPSALEKATIQRDIIELEDRLYRMRCAVSPVRSLLPEVLGQIFVAAATMQYAPGERIDTGQVVDLSLVCKAWRAAAEMTHSLWADVLIPKPGPRVFDKVVAWMGRSGSTPKTLRIRLSSPGSYCERHAQAWVDADDNETSPDPDYPAPRCVLDGVPLLKLLTEGLHLDAFEIGIATTSCLKLVLLRVQQEASKGTPWMSLRSMDLRLYDQETGGPEEWWEWQESSDPSASMFNYLPSSLTSLRIRLPSALSLHRADDYDTHSQTPIHIPASTLRNLTSFTIVCDWDGRQIATFLQHCTKVEYLNIEYGIRPMQLWTRETNALVQHNLPPRIHLPELRTLKVHEIPHCTAEHILHFIDAPALLRIEVGIQKSTEDEDVFGENEELTILRPICLFLDSLGLLHPPRAAILQSLTISNDDFFEAGFSDIDIISILSPLLSLKHLIVVAVKFVGDEAKAGDSFAVMRRYMDDHQTLLLPCLEYLEFADYYWAFPLESLLRFIEARHRRYAQHQASAGGNKAPDSLRRVVFRNSESITTLEEDCESASTVALVRRLGISLECIRPRNWK